MLRFKYELKMRRFILPIICTLCLGGTAFSQALNDECITATALGAVSDYCSGDSEFSNRNATLSAEAIPFCWFGGAEHDVWFTFVPTAPSVYINLDGSFAPNGLVNPQIEVFEGFCGNLTEVACNSISAGTSVADLTLETVVIGQVYYLRVDGRDGREGEFRLCINSFIPIPSPESDCPDAVVLCDKSSFEVANLNSTGSIQNELTGPCVGTGQDAERASVWYVWTCKDSGTLTFTLTPNNTSAPDEDLDFVVYELPGGLTDCNNRIGVRCMLSGETANQNSSPCFGPTGLREGETDVSETAGCSPGDNNFVAPLDMIAGQSYGIIINNFSQSGFGFGVEFGGTGTFLGPEADFELTLPTVEQIFECDKTIIFNDASLSNTDQIVEWVWNFGAGATPSFATGIGPHDVVYDSFGDKIAALTITSDRGCTVTEILDFYIEPCCADISTLDLAGFATDVSCFGSTDGTITATGIAGDPQYLYSLDGVNFLPNTLFNGLEDGQYQIYVQDIKGCLDSVIVNISEPLELSVYAGEDMEIELGDPLNLNATPTNGTGMLTYMWSPAEGLSCTDCPNPIFLGATTTYTVTVTDENGCTAIDEVTIRADLVKRVYAPNIFSPNNDGRNDRFTIFVGKGVDAIQDLSIYDRWGNLVFFNENLIINDPQDGWDGTFNKQPSNPGVFTWTSNIRFVGNITCLFKGNVTLAK